MKKSSLIIISILLVLIAFSIYIYKSKYKLSSVEEDSRNFSFKDTAAITKIFIADKEGDKCSIERTKEGWLVNGKYKCRSEAILNLLEVIKNVEVKMSVPKQSKQNVIKFMTSNALKVEIYSEDNLVKQYYVGHETPDSEGSYMLLTDIDKNKNFKDPFVCFIPGFVGFLQPRFIAKENEWRDRVVLNYIPPQLKQIKVTHYKESSDSSFIIDVINSNSFKLKNSQNKELLFDENKMRQYLIYFQNISYEVLITGKNKKLQDSLSSLKPFSEIEITTIDSKKNQFKFYRKQFMGDIVPEMNIKYSYDPDRFYLSFDQDKEWALIQYFVFGKLLISSSYFTQGNPVKK